MAVAVEQPNIADVTFELPLEQLHLPEDNVRRTIGDVAELARSIAAVGVLEPVVVTPRRVEVITPGGQELDATDGYLVVCGSRRVAGASAAGLTHVPAIVRQFTEEERVEAMVVENLQREDLTPLEEAAAFQRLVDLGLSQRMIATRLGVSQSHVSKRLSLLELPRGAQKALDSGLITLEDASKLGKLGDHPARVAAVLKDVRWGSLARNVERQLYEVDVEQKIARARAEHEKAGIPIVEYVRDRYNQRALPKGTKYIREYGYGAETVELKPAKHKGCAGRAVAIDVNGSVHEVCTTPTVHKPKAGENNVSPAEAKRNAQEKALREARKVRHAFIRTLLAKPPLKAPELLQTLTRTLIGEAWQDKRKIACELLELDAEPYATKPYSGADKWELALLDEASNPRKTATVALAIFFAVAEVNIKATYHSWTAADGGYLALLEEHGYEISPAERAELKERALR